MAHTAQARKRVRQATGNRLRNASIRSRFRTYIKKVVNAIESGDKKEAESAYKNAVPVIDATVSKGIIHRNKAARHKSRLNARIRGM